ncbi:MAG: ECF transporter S component [Lachnospiraceae bacterium]|nr:ECF transporter S component [Lachnospiraceae bacterium]
MKKKNPITLIIGVTLLALGIFFGLRTYHSSYAESRTLSDTLSEVNTSISNVQDSIEAASDTEAKTALEEQLQELQTRKDRISEEKLSLERPYSYSLILVFLGVLVSITGLVVLIKGTAVNPKADLLKLAQAGLLAALCYIGFAFFKIDMPGHVAFHFGNVFCVLAALLLGSFWGGLAGAVGMSIADLTTAYVTSAPKTFLLKLCIGVIVGLVAHGIFKLADASDKKKIVGVTVFASACGMVFNMVADPLVGYFYKTYLLGIPQDLAKAMTQMATIVTSVNAVLAVIFASIFYLALRPAIKKAGLLVTEKTNTSTRKK